MAGVMAREVLFSDGEEFDPTDLNNAQRFLYAMIGDGLLAGLAPHLDLSGSPGIENGTHLYALGDSGAPFEDGSGTRTPNFLRGLVAQRLTSADPDGDDSQVLLYFLDPNEPQVARPAVTTDPRWDVVSIQLARATADSQSRDFQDGATRALSTSSFDKQRQVVATITWTQGVEAASPVEPSIPAGDVKLAAFKIRPSVTTFAPATDIRDYRMPLAAVRRLRSDRWGVIHDDGAGPRNYDLGSHGGVNNSASATLGDLAHAGCPVEGGSARILAVGLSSNRISGSLGAALLSLVRHDDRTSTVLLRNLTALLATAGTSALYAEFDILASHGEPLWSNGYAAGYAVDRIGASATGGPERLYLEFTPDTTGETSALRVVRWTLVG